MENNTAPDELETPTLSLTETPTPTPTLSLTETPTPTPAPTLSLAATVGGDGDERKKTSPGGVEKSLSKRMKRGRAERGEQHVSKKMKGVTQTVEDDDVDSDWYCWCKEDYLDHTWLMCCKCKNKWCDRCAGIDFDKNGDWYDEGGFTCKYCKK